MKEKQKKFLELAIIEQKTFDEISNILKIERVLVSEWWEELKKEREYLSNLRKIWKAKFKETKTASFWKFKEWFESAEKKCYYCGITESQISLLFKKGNLYTKRNRGSKLEIDRKEPDLDYDNIENLVFSCYWCNNAKTDTFTSEEFKQIGLEIGKVWKNRLENDN